MKKEYLAPEIEIMYISADIITFSEEEEWTGPVIGANNEDVPMG